MSRANKAKPAAKRARAPLDVNIAIRQLQKLEATAHCVAYAMNEEMEGVDFSDAVVLIAEGLGATLMTLDQVEAPMGQEARHGRK
jgi:hypothetical protein